MSDSNQEFDLNPENAQENWNQFMEQMNENFVDALEQNMEAQAAFVEQWTETVEQSADEEEMTEGLEGYAKAYETWMNAANQIYEKANDAAQGEEVDPSEFRDIWLNAANDAFKEVMSTTAFASATGEVVGDVLEIKEQADEAANDTLHQLGFATAENIEEVGERIVELERRQHKVEKKLDKVLDKLDDLE